MATSLAQTLLPPKNNPKTAGCPVNPLLLEAGATEMGLGVWTSYPANGKNLRAMEGCKVNYSVLPIEDFSPGKRRDKL